MQKSLQKILLGTALFSAGLSLTGCNSNKSKTYENLEKYSCDSIYCKKGIENLKQMYNNIDLNNLSEKEKKLLKLDQKQRKQRVIDFENFFDVYIIDTDNVSDKDMIFIKRWYDKINFIGSF